MSFSIVSGILSADVANLGTFTVGYAPGRNQGYFQFGTGSKLQVDGFGDLEAPVGFSFSLGATLITVTNRSGSTMKAGTAFRLQMEELGDRQFRTGYDRNKSAVRPVTAPPLTNASWRGGLIVVSLGAPVVGAATQVTTAQLTGAAADLAIDGTLAVGGVAFTDGAPRNFTLTDVTTNQSAITFTVRGFDEYGNAMTETLAGPNNNTVSGKKAFRRISRVSASAAILTNGVSVGFGNVLGLPLFLPAAGFILKELQDGAVATAGTTVAGVQTAGGATATDGDVRGTYLPNATPDGTKELHLVLCLPDPGYLGFPQFAA